MFFMTIPQIKDLADKGSQGESGSLLFCFFGSIAEMWASAYMCDNYSNAYLGCGEGWTCKGGKCKYDTCTDLEGWGVTVGCVSAIVCLVFIILGIAKVDLNVCAVDGSRKSLLSSFSSGGYLVLPPSPSRTKTKMKNGIAKVPTVCLWGPEMVTLGPGWPSFHPSSLPM